MATVSPSDLPEHAVAATAMAESLVDEFRRQGGDIRTLFVTFAGLVSARDKVVGADCLVALDTALFPAGNAT